ncbi:MAG: putative glycine dehydrogenase (decarboxylating) subunit 1 [Candidatus Latescibacteria bacterium ADurb.Bin168]|nr:MAG: putative glycine dehydrogenase (decarboxylating) subunit 1 [Candidatus Latescibacteria bacterium ADurb.Bin168]
MADPHPFIPCTDADLAEMLAAIGVRSFEDLFAPVPEAIRAASALDLPPRLSEHEALSLLRRRARENTPEAVCFLGAGMYDRIIPAAIDAVIQRSEFTTAYTPYQPEVSQGTLQAVYEFQTMVCELFGMDVANASVYDGASALTEAILLSHAHIGRRKVVFAGPVHPRYRSAFCSITVGIGLEPVEAPFSDGGADPAAVAERVNRETACVVVQQPNFYGIVEDIAALAAIAHREGALLVVSADPVALSLLEAPGKQGADVVVGEGQPLGIPMSFGGPALGLFAVRDELKRRLPGRLVGRTVDTRGQQAFVLTLQTREQHIRREKATSNICSNQNLMAIAATMYLTLLGPAGLRQVAENSLQNAHYAADEIEARTAFRRVHTRPFFDEFVVQCPVPARDVVDRLVPRGILAGVDMAHFGGDPAHLMIAVTEKRTKEEIDALVAALGEIG